MPSADVRQIMGEGEVVRYKKVHLLDPWRSESFALTDGSNVLILFYVTEPPQRYYRPDDRALTPIVLEEDRVVRVGLVVPAAEFRPLSNHDPGAYVGCCLTSRCRRTTPWPCPSRGSPPPTLDVPASV
jgi:hypothetical protein